MESRIREIVRSALTELGAGEAVFAVERPTDLKHGDYAVNAALVVAKQLGKSPREIAEHLVAVLADAFKKVGDTAKLEIAGPGFVNITLSPECVREAIDTLATTQNSLVEKRVMIEYSNPNAFKEMHAGHLVGTVVGESLSRLIENDGATVMRDTFGGDVGPNVAKALWALKRRGVTEPESAQEIGSAYAEGANAYETDAAAKEEIDALNQAIYAGTDAELMTLWKRGREISMEEFRRLWKLLDTHFDFELFDSDTTETGLRVVREGLAKGIFKESEGAVVYDGTEKGVHTMVFITSRGTPTYEAKDIGLAFLKEERWSADEFIILTGNEQTGRFKTVLAALSDIAPALAGKIRHIATGFLRLTSGKMSSREGNVITAASLIEDVAKRSSEKNSDPLVAAQVAVGAVKFMILRQAPGSDIVFDPEQSLSLEGDSGPYLQYALVRARKILAATPGAGGKEIPLEPYAIERALIHYPAAVSRALVEYAPSYVAQYLIELASEWNSFYANEQILGSAEEEYKIHVAQVFERVMAHGLSLLAIPAPARM